jgi:D-sedoheptulose 7-phosphate isomerase
MEKIFIEAFASATRHLQTFADDAEVRQSLVLLTQKICAMDAVGGKILIAGNGGSMADAMHFAEEMSGRFRGERRPLAALSLSDPTHISCVSNDYGYNHIFSRMVEAFANKNDVVILLSTSGNSENLLLAAEVARRKGAFLAAFLGGDGGKLLPLCDLSILAPGKTSDRIQELHMLALHILVEAVEVGLDLV